MHCEDIFVTATSTAFTAFSTKPLASKRARSPRLPRASQKVSGGYSSVPELDFFFYFSLLFWRRNCIFWNDFYVLKLWLLFTFYFVYWRHVLVHQQQRLRWRFHCGGRPCSKSSTPFERGLTVCGCRGNCVQVKVQNSTGL